MFQQSEWGINIMKFNKTVIHLALLGLGVGTFSMATAQDAGSDQTAQLEEVIVTGSRIKRSEANSASPMTIIEAESIFDSGIANVEDILQEMTASAGPAGNSSNAYWTSNGYGTAQVNLRGLGINRTLVLLNGRRIVNGGTGANSSVDLNMIPSALIQRIEVLKDGASAIYGADAVAGVVNIITKKDFSGAKLDVKYGATTQSDGENSELNFTFGGDYDKGNIAVNLSYVDTGLVLQSDRQACPFYEDSGELVCFGSSTTIGGRAHLLDGTEIQFNQVLGGDGDFYEPRDGAKHGFNWFPYLNAVSPTQRINVSAFGNYEISDSLNVFTEILYANRQGEQIVTPRRIRTTRVSAEFPYNPTGEDLFIKSRRMVEMGAPYFFQETDTVRVVVGLEGSFDNGLSWDASANYGRNTGRDGWTFDIDHDRVSQTLDESICSTAAGAALPCGDYFGVGELTPELIEYIKYRREGNGGNQMVALNANLYGNLMSLPAGDVGFAVGIENRTQKGWRNPDSTVLKNGGESAISGSSDVTEVYGELSVPLLSDMPMVQSLDLTLAARWSDYSAFGDNTTYKLGAVWQVNDQLTLRSVVSTAFRVPTISEQEGSTNQENLLTVDPCAGATGAIATNCAADGIPAGFVQNGNTVLTGVGGNPNVGPEDADTVTFGIVFEPAFMEGLTATIDYFDIKMKDAINAVDGSDQLRLCYTDPSVYAEFCNSFVRDSITNQVTFLNKRPVNASNEQVSGVDYALTYNTEIAGLDSLFSIRATNLLTHENQANPAAEVEILRGKITSDRGSFAKWRMNMSAKVYAEKWSAGWSVRMIGEAEDENGEAWGGGPMGNSVDNIFYHDLHYNYNVSDTLKVSLGIDNVFDEKAPFITSWNDANTDVFTYDLMGQRWFMQASYEF
jgi:iron complex outermembrane receptor protein|tara:strand:+ start:3191 stop:5896 length:2706 start_codon:yes stop_codon:yes gene_type:complete